MRELIDEERRMCDEVFDCLEHHGEEIHGRNARAMIVLRDRYNRGKMTWDCINLIRTLHAQLKARYPNEFNLVKI